VVPVYGEPDSESTPIVERSNLSLRMGLRRLTRLTNGFSKKLDKHWAAVILWYAYYNFCRIHKSLRVTLRWKQESPITSGTWPNCLPEVLLWYRISSDEHRGYRYHRFRWTTRHRWPPDVVVFTWPEVRREAREKWGAIMFGILLLGSVGATPAPAKGNWLFTAFVFARALSGVWLIAFGAKGSVVK